MNAGEVIGAIPEQKSVLRTVLILVIFLYSTALGGAIWLMTNRIETLKEANLVLQQRIDQLESVLQREEAAPDFSLVQAKITSNKDSDLVDEYFTLSGTYTSIPEGASLRVLISPTSVGGYWPQPKMEYDEEHKTWQVSGQVGGKSGETHLLMVVVAGAEGQALFDYYTKVGKVTNNWVGIDVLPSDVHTLDKVVVLRK